MTRIVIIKIIAIICLAQGLWDVGEFLYPFFFLSAPIPIKVDSLIRCILEIYAGINLFKLRETGRKLLFSLSFIGAVIVAIFTFWIAVFWRDGFGSALYFFSDVIFKTENRFVSAGISLVFFIILFLIAVFLSQEKTRVLFDNDKRNDTDTTALRESG